MGPCAGLWHTYPHRSNRLAYPRDFPSFRLGGSPPSESQGVVGRIGDATTMKQNLWYLLFGIAPVLLLASSGAKGAQLTVLGLTLGIFFGTLSLRRPDPSDATSTNSGT